MLPVTITIEAAMTKTFAITALCATSAFAAVKVRDNTQLHPSEVWTPEQEKAAGIVMEDLGGIERPHGVLNILSGMHRRYKAANIRQDIKTFMHLSEIQRTA